MIYLQLFWEFFKTGLFAVGGGMATLPFLIDMSAKTGWFTTEELANMVAVSESTPGPIGVNMATYVGFTSAGDPGSGARILGALVASLGLITPSVIVILIVAAFLKAFRSNPYVDRAFSGIRPASTGLIASAALSLVILCMFSGGGLNLKGIVLFVCVWVLSNLVPKVKDLHPIVFIGISALAGVLFKFAH